RIQPPPRKDPPHRRVSTHPTTRAAIRRSRGGATRVTRKAPRPPMPDPIYILNGPNLNRLGAREPHIYGAASLDAVREACEAKAGTLGYAVEFRQTNHEGELVTWVQEAADRAAALVINPA